MKFHSQVSVRVDGADHWVELPLLMSAEEVVWAAHRACVQFHSEPLMCDPTPVQRSIHEQIRNLVTTSALPPQLLLVETPWVTLDLDLEWDPGEP